MAYTLQAHANSMCPRTAAETVVFWGVWVLTLMPSVYFLFISVMYQEALLAPLILLQFGLHAIAMRHFLNKQQVFSTALLWLIGGTCIIYILFISGFFIILTALHSY
jgi:hypothetical protein